MSPEYKVTVVTAPKVHTFDRSHNPMYPVSNSHSPRIRYLLRYSSKPPRVSAEVTARQITVSTGCVSDGIRIRNDKIPDPYPSDLFLSRHKIRSTRLYAKKAFKLCGLLIEFCWTVSKVHCIKGTVLSHEMDVAFMTCMDSLGLNRGRGHFYIFRWSNVFVTHKVFIAINASLRWLNNGSPGFLAFYWSPRSGTFLKLCGLSFCSNWILLSR